MEGAFDKFSLYDFFNLIFVGAIFLIALHMIGLYPLTYIANYIRLPNNNIIICISILLVCYIIGFVFQTIGSILEKNTYFFGIQTELINNFLNDKSVFNGNECKFKSCRDKARQFFIKKGIKINKEYTWDQCEYFFAHCSYCIQVNGKSEKTEKIRALKGLSCMLTVCFAILIIIMISYVAILIFLAMLFKKENILDEIVAVSVLIYLEKLCLLIVLFVLSYNRFQINTRYWVRMVLGVYDICSD